MNVRIEKFWSVYVINAELGGSGFLINEYKLAQSCWIDLVRIQNVSVSYQLVDQCFTPWISIFMDHKNKSLCWNI